jgi:hypothetical protein
MEFTARHSGIHVLIPGRLRQKDYKFRAILGYIHSKTLSQKQNNNKKKGK